MPCRDGGPPPNYRPSRVLRPEEEEEDDDEYDYDAEEIEEAVAEFGIDQVLECVAEAEDFDPANMPASFRAAIEPYVQALIDERAINSTYRANDATRSACAAMRVIEEFGLSEEVDRDTREWWNDHKVADAERKSLLIRKVQHIRRKRRIRP